MQTFAVALNSSNFRCHINIVKGKSQPQENGIIGCGFVLSKTFACIILYIMPLRVGLSFAMFNGTSFQQFLWVQICIGGGPGN